MKLPVFHKYYTINLLIYLILVNFILCVCFGVSLIFRNLLYELGDIFGSTVYCLNLYVLPLSMVTVIIEFILRLAKVLKTNLHPTIKFPIFHNYCTVNLLIYVLIINALLCLSSPFSMIDLVFFKGPVGKEKFIITQVIFYLNMCIIPTTVVGIFIEWILAKTKKFTRKLQTIQLKRWKTVLLWIFTTIFFLFFLLMNDICRDYATPYTPEELEQLRYD